MPLPPDDLRLQAMHWESNYVQIENYTAPRESQQLEARLVPIELELVEVQIQQVQAHQQ